MAEKRTGKSTYVVRTDAVVAKSGTAFYGEEGSALVDVNYDREIPPWWAGPYREDVPKR
jgi:hypothetical protein